MPAVSRGLYPLVQRQVVQRLVARADGYYCLAVVPLPGEPERAVLVGVQLQGTAERTADGGEVPQVDAADVAFWPDMT